MTEKEISEIRRRFKPEKTNISRVRGCLINEKCEIISEFDQSFALMYENESAAVRAGIDFLQALTEKDYLLDPTFDVLDLEQKLIEIQADVNYLISNLPVEAIDDDQEREEKYPGDFEDSEELEDEVVECEKLIAQATKLLATVREHYLPSEVATAAPAAAAPQTKPVRKKRYINWSNVILIGIIIAIIAYIIINDAV